MKDRDKTGPMRLFPQRIRTYLIFNLVIAVLMAVVMASHLKLRSGRFLFIDIALIFFYCGAIASIFVGPFAAVEIYLYRRKKGIWYDWTNQTRRLPGDLAMSPAERRHWKSEAYLARLSQGGEPGADHGNRTRLFEPNDAAGRVSRAALLMTVADKLERSGKREAAEQCYLQITQRFADSQEAREAARRLSSASKV